MFDEFRLPHVLAILIGGELGVLDQVVKVTEHFLKMIIRRDLHNLAPVLCLHNQFHFEARRRGEKPVRGQLATASPKFDSALIVVVKTERDFRWSWCGISPVLVTLLIPELM